MRDARQVIRQLLAPSVQRVRHSIGLALLDLIAPHSGLLRAQVKIVGGGSATGNVMQNYGHASVPPAGAQGVKLAIGGNPNHIVIVAMDDGRSRPDDLQAGDSCLWTEQGDRVWIKNGRIIAINAGSEVDVTTPTATFHCSTKVRLETPLVETTQDMHVGGNLTSGGDISDAHGSMQTMRGKFNPHKHGTSPGPDQVM